MGTHSNSQLVFDPNNQKDASSDYAKAKGYQSNVGYNAREIRRFSMRTHARQPNHWGLKAVKRKPQGFK